MSLRVIVINGGDNGVLGTFPSLKVAEEYLKSNGWYVTQRAPHEGKKSNLDVWADVSNTHTARIHRVMSVTR